MFAEKELSELERSWAIIAAASASASQQIENALNQVLQSLRVLDVED